MTITDIELTGVAAGPKRGRLHRTPIIVITSILILAATAVCAVLGSVITPFSPSAQDLLNVSQPPTGEHWLGTDNLGQDVLSRIMVGSRWALIGPLAIAVGSLLLGGLLGLLAGYLGGWVDASIMRVVDFVFAFPHLLIILVVAGIVGGGYGIGVALLVVFLAPHITRLVRGGRSCSSARCHTSRRHGPSVSHSAGSCSSI